MEYPIVRYAKTDHDEYLELYSFDGTCRGVVFATAQDALEALSPGRAELDCAAVQHGFLPVGARLVSRAGLAADVVEAEPEAMDALRRLVAATEYITPESDEQVRQRRPVERMRYDAMAADASRSHHARLN